MDRTESDHSSGGSGNVVLNVLSNIVEINRRSVFSLIEARELLPVVFRITKNYAQKVESLIERLESLPMGNDALVSKLETQVNSHIQEWQDKIQKLGALPKGMWIADFDSGDGYYCWKFPERNIDYWHKYSDGYSKRVLVEERLRPISLFGSTPATLRPTEHEG